MKETEVLELNWNSMMVVSKSCAHVDWLKISRALKEKYSQNYVINPFMVDKTLLKFSNGRLLSTNELSGISQMEKSRRFSLENREMEL